VRENTKKKGGSLGNETCLKPIPIIPCIEEGKKGETGRGRAYEGGKNQISPQFIFPEVC